MPKLNSAFKVESSEHTGGKTVKQVFQQRRAAVRFADRWLRAQASHLNLGFRIEIWRVNTYRPGYGEELIFEGKVVDRKKIRIEEVIC